MVMTMVALGLLRGKQRKHFTRNGQQIKKATVLFSGQVVLERMVIGMCAGCKLPGAGVCPQAV